MFLVVGANGQLGNELKLILGGNAEYVDRERLDITDAAAVKAFVKPEKYAAVINCAAYTAVDKAESDAVLAEKSMWTARGIWPRRACRCCRCRRITFLTAPAIVRIRKATKPIRSRCTA